MVVIVLGGRLDVRFCARDGGASGTGQISLSLSIRDLIFGWGPRDRYLTKMTPDNARNSLKYMKTPVITLFDP